MSQHAWDHLFGSLDYKGSKTKVYYTCVALDECAGTGDATRSKTSTARRNRSRCCCPIRSPDGLPTIGIQLVHHLCGNTGSYRYLNLQTTYRLAHARVLVVSFWAWGINLSVNEALMSNSCQQVYHSGMIPTLVHVGVQFSTRV